jgi:hypothetical protein
MERRGDALLRQVVAQAEPVLEAGGFAVADRGTFGEYRWVEFVRGRSSQDAQLPSSESLVIFHLTGHQHLGARLQRYSLWRCDTAPAPSKTRLGQLWPYEPESGTTATGEPVDRAVLDWLTATTAPHPPTASDYLN